MGMFSFIDFLDRNKCQFHSFIHITCMYVLVWTNKKVKRLFLLESRPVLRDKKTRTREIFVQLLASLYVLHCHSMVCISFLWFFSTGLACKFPCLYVLSVVFVLMGGGSGSDVLYSRELNSTFLFGSILLSLHLKSQKSQPTCHGIVIHTKRKFEKFRWFPWCFTSDTKYAENFQQKAHEARPRICFL